MYYVYIVQCCDGTLYTGSTNDVCARLRKHNEGKGAKYTRGRTPVVPVYVEELPDKSTALKREYEVKKYSRKQKEKLITTHTESAVIFPGNEHLKYGEVIQMAKRSSANTNVNQVRQQNAASQMGQSETEFASETDVQAVRQANQQSAAKAQQNNQQSNQSNLF